MSEDNRDELARLIREHLEDRGLNVTKFVAMFPSANHRSVYNWLSGEKAPRSVTSLKALEEVLGWKRGAVKEVLTAPITKKFTLAELRDWEKLGETPDRPAIRASELSTDELLVELTRRVGSLQSEIEFLRKQAPADQRPHVFDLAASGTEAGRNMEHLEGNEEDN